MTQRPVKRGTRGDDGVPTHEQDAWLGDAICLLAATLLVLADGGWRDVDRRSRLTRNTTQAQLARQLGLHIGQGFGRSATHRAGTAYEAMIGCVYREAGLMAALRRAQEDMGEAAAPVGVRQPQPPRGAVADLAAWAEDAGLRVEYIHAVHIHCGGWAAMSHGHLTAAAAAETAAAKLLERYRTRQRRPTEHDLPDWRCVQYAPDSARWVSRTDAAASVTVTAEVLHVEGSVALDAVSRCAAMPEP